jgi:hypothetical protein
MGISTIGNINELQGQKNITKNETTKIVTTTTTSNNVLGQNVIAATNNNANINTSNYSKGYEMTQYTTTTNQHSGTQQVSSSSNIFGGNLIQVLNKEISKNEQEFNAKNQNQNQNIINETHTEHIIGENGEIIKKVTKTQTVEYNSSLGNMDNYIFMFMCPLFNSNQIVGAFESENTGKIEVDFSQAFSNTDIHLNEFPSGGAYCNYNKILYFTGGQEKQSGLGKIFLRISVQLSDYKVNLTKMPNMLYSHWNHSMIVNDNYVFVVGGYNSNKCEYFNFKTLKWGGLPNLNSEERQRAMLIIYKDYLYAFMGYTQFGILDSVERINIAKLGTSQWEKVSISNPQRINLKKLVKEISSVIKEHKCAYLNEICENMSNLPMPKNVNHDYKYGTIRIINKEKLLKQYTDKIILLAENNYNKKIKELKIYLVETFKKMYQIRKKYVQMNLNKNKDASNYDKQNSYNNMQISKNENRNLNQINPKKNINQNSIDQYYNNNYENEINNNIDYGEEEEYEDIDKNSQSINNNREYIDEEDNNNHIDNSNNNEYIESDFNSIYTHNECKEKDYNNNDYTESNYNYEIEDSNYEDIKENDYNNDEFIENASDSNNYNRESNYERILYNKNNNINDTNFNYNSDYIYNKYYEEINNNVYEAPKYQIIEYNNYNREGYNDNVVNNDEMIQYNNVEEEFYEKPFHDFERTKIIYCIPNNNKNGNEILLLNNKGNKVLISDVYSRPKKINNNSRVRVFTSNNNSRLNNNYYYNEVYQDNNISNNNYKGYKKTHRAFPKRNDNHSFYISK